MLIQIFNISHFIMSSMVQISASSCIAWRQDYLLSNIIVVTIRKLKVYVIIYPYFFISSYEAKYFCFYFAYISSINWPITTFKCKIWLKYHAPCNERNRSFYYLLIDQCLVVFFVFFAIVKMTPIRVIQENEWILKEHIGSVSFRNTVQISAS